MAHYTKIDHNTAVDIFRLYGFKDEIVKITPLSTGISNSNYRIQFNTDAPVVLKVSNDKNKNQLQEEMEVLALLKKLGFKNSLIPYQTKEESFIYEHLGLYGSIFPCIEGSVLSINRHNIFLLGQILAKLHKCSEDISFSSHLRKYDDIGHSSKSILTYINTSECPLDFKENFFKLYPQGELPFSGTSFKKGIIHGDLYFDNVLIDKNNHLTLLDFEQSGVGEYLLDIGVSISGSCLSHGHLDHELITKYLEGYESVRKLPAEEKKFMNDAIILGLFSIALWRIDRFYTGHLDQEKKNSYQELVSRALRFSKEID